MGRNRNPRQTIEQLQSNIKQMEVEHQKQIQEVKQSYEAEHRKQSEYIDKILRYFPYVEKLMPMIKYLSEKTLIICLHETKTKVIV